MPADDLAESIETVPEALSPPQFAIEPPRPTSEHVEWSAFARWPVEPGADLQESATDAAGVLAASMTPLVEAILVPVPAPEDVRPAAAAESVPAGWWTDALPWRTETPAAADQDIASAVESPWCEATSVPECEAADESPSSVPVECVDEIAAPPLHDEPAAAIDAAADDGDAAVHEVLATVFMPVVSELPETAVAVDTVAPVDDVREDASAVECEPGVGEDFGYLSLEAVDARAAMVEAVAVDTPVELPTQPDASTDEVAWPHPDIDDVVAVAAVEDGLVDEATSPAGEYRLFADIAPVVSHEEAEAEPAETEAPAGLYWADDAPLLTGFGEVPEEPVAEVVALDEAPLAADAVVPVDEDRPSADIAPVVLQDEEGVAPAAAFDATGVVDETPGGDEVAASWGEDPLSSDIAPVVPEDVADAAPEFAGVDEALAEASVEVVADDETDLTAYTAAALVETQDEESVAVDATGVPDENPSGDEAAAPAGEYRLFGDIEPAALQEDADIEAPDADALFGSHHVDSAPVTAAASLLAREATENTTPDWRHAFLSSTLVEAPVAEGTRSSFGAESEPMPWTEPPLALEAPELSTEPAPQAADAPATDPCVPDLADEPEPPLQPRPAEPAQHSLSATVADLVPTLVIVDDGPDRDAWDDLRSEVSEIQDVPEYAAVIVAPDAQIETAEREDDVAVAPTPVSVPTASVARKKKKRSRRKKGGQADALDMAPAVIADVVPAVAVAVAPILAPSAAGDAAQSAVTPSASSLLEREVPTWTPPADLGIRRTPAVAVAVEPGAQPDASGLTGERTPSPTMPVAAAPPLSVASTVEVVRPVTAASAPPAPEAWGAFEQEIRAVGMPDLEDLAPRPDTPQPSCRWPMASGPRRHRPRGWCRSTHV